MTIREQILSDLVRAELFYGYQIVDGKKVPTYVAAGYDKEKIEAEGSIWMVYVYDCMADYYKKHKKHFHKLVEQILLKELEEVRNEDNL